MVTTKRKATPRAPKVSDRAKQAPNHVIHPIHRARWSEMRAPEVDVHPFESTTAVPPAKPPRKRRAAPRPVQGFRSKEELVSALQAAQKQLLWVPPLPKVIGAVLYAVTSGDNGPLVLLDEASTADPEVILDAAVRLWHLRATRTSNPKDVALASKLALLRGGKNWFANKRTARRTEELLWMITGCANILKHFVKAALARPARAGAHLEAEYASRLATAFLGSALLDGNRVILAEEGLSPDVDEDAMHVHITRDYQKMLLRISPSRRSPGNEAYVQRVVDHNVVLFTQCGYRALGMTKAQAQNLFRFYEQQQARRDDKARAGAQ